MNLRLRSFRPAALFILMILMLTGCGNGTVEVISTPDMNEVVTSAVQTYEAEHNEAAAVIPTDTPVPVSPTLPAQANTSEAIVILPLGTDEPAEMLVNPYLQSDADTAEIAEEIQAPTAAAATDLSISLPTMASVLPTATLAPNASGDRAAYEGQSPADGTHFKPGAKFDIQWYWTNTGTTTWTTNYTCRFFTGTDFTKPGKERYPLIASVPPNTSGSCIVDAVAPLEPGQYKMSVVLSNENDENFTIVDLTIWVD